VNTGGELGEDGVLAFFLIFFDPEHCGGVIDGAIGTSTNISIMMRMRAFAFTSGLV